MSETAPAIFWKMGAQVGFVIWQTRMSPGCRLRDFLDAAHHARRAFDYTAGGREPADFMRVTLPGLEPGIETLTRDAPEHHDGRVIDDVGHWPERGRGVLARPFLDRGASLGDFGGPVRRPARR